ncbi:MAG: hypothetical protein Q9216_002330 [Gyalolechia sp. 2 TL-2023]
MPRDEQSRGRDGKSRGRSGRRRSRSPERSPAARRELEKIGLETLLSESQGDRTRSQYRSRSPLRQRSPKQRSPSPPRRRPRRHHKAQGPANPPAPASSAVPAIKPASAFRTAVVEGSDMTVDELRLVLGHPRFRADIPLGAQLKYIRRRERKAARGHPNGSAFKVEEVGDAEAEEAAAGETEPQEGQGRALVRTSGSGEGAPEAQARARSNLAENTELPSSDEDEGVELEPARSER